MRYALLICTEDKRQAEMSEDEAGAQMAAYMAWGEEMGGRGVLQGGERLRPTADGDHRAGPRRRGAHVRRPVRGDQGADGRLLPGRLQGPRRGHRGGVEDPGRHARVHRGAADLGDVSRPTRRSSEAVARCVPGRVGARRRHPDPDHGRLGPRRGVRAGRVRARRSSAGRATASRATPAPGSRPPPATARSTACVARATRRGEDAGGRCASMPDEPTAAIDDSGVADDRLRLIFTCCHPALSVEAQVALTLRTLAGLTTAEIARAFLVPEATMAQRLVRREAQDPRRRHPVPRAARAPAARAHRGGARACSTSCSTRATRRAAAPSSCARDLCAEAIRLARTLAELMPDEPEALGLLALMLLHDARRDGARRRRRRARAARGPGPHARWDRDDDRRRRRRCSTARCGARDPGPYQVQAAIAALPRDRAARRGDTDWHEIALLYGELVRMIRLAGRRAEPRGRGGDGRRTRSRTGRSSTALADRLDAYSVPPRRPRRPAAPPRSQRRRRGRVRPRTRAHDRGDRNAPTSNAGSPRCTYRADRRSRSDAVSRRRSR